ncbi:hypothetical protein SCHPADRAFT_648178 [Schizopora paradoxa]|uniref:Uncharacterized protein n=1 Tax=Schizopora paradoxa TaxID=27342 RepID=A0A0H2R6M8_9AGAM|nr:hypothetical protein SCHPADRAFT_648178 [Schizopora paradoxa]
MLQWKAKLASCEVIRGPKIFIFDSTGIRFYVTKKCDRDNIVGTQKLSMWRPENPKSLVDFGGACQTRDQVDQPFQNGRSGVRKETAGSEPTCQRPGSSSSPMSSSNVHRRPESNRLTVEYIRPSRQSIQEYNDFLNDADVQAAAAASNNLELLNKLNNRLSSKRSSSSKSTAGMFVSFRA